MDPMLDPVATATISVLLLSLLFALWWSATRRHMRRREQHRREWENSEVRPELWTSAARCPHCERRGGLLEVDGDDLWFECLSCQRRHRRESRA